MSLHQELRELRLMRGQSGYRHLLGWILVVIGLCRAPIIWVAVAWFTTQSGAKPAALKAIAPLVAEAIRAIK